MAEAGDSMDEVMFPQNNARVAAQNALDIRVILGNPPYSSGQTSQNDGNQNQKYPSLDASIAGTYAARGTATLKNSLYDSYIRALRWASNRVLTSEQGGVVGFVTNGGFIDSNTADGLRKSLADEFHAIYCFNLRGNQRTAGELSKKEGGKVFGAGSRSTVAITLLIKKPGSTSGATIQYLDVGDYLTREEKLQAVAEASLPALPWVTITPNQSGDWINQRDAAYEAFAPMGVKAGAQTPPVFSAFSGGLKTNRDAWVYNSSEERVLENVTQMIDFYNGEVERYQALPNPPTSVDDFLNRDPKRFSWDWADKTQLVKGTKYKCRAEAVVVGLYRPFNKLHVYFDRQLNNRVYQLPRMFPPDVPNHGIFVVGPGSAVPFTALMVDALPDLCVTGAGSAGQFFPRYTYERVDEHDLFSEDDAEHPGWRRLDNIHPATLATYRSAFGELVSADDVFHYVYAALHATDYRTRFAADLKKMLPRIPMVASASEFQGFVEAGRQLSSLHLSYEEAAPFPLDEVVSGAESPDLYKVSKMSFAKLGRAPDRRTILYNSRLTLRGIPAEAYEYQVGSRSAIEWVMERYQVKADKASGIVNDPNDWADEVGYPRYIVDLIKRIVTVSVETVKIVKSLPSVVVDPS